MRRYASIDFLRGFAIWLMILLHSLMRVYDRSWSEDMDLLEQLPLIYMILMLIILFLAGWAGFFLLISSIGNTLSMQKALKRGDSVLSVVSKQVLLGFLLLLCALFIESIGGYHSMLGNLVSGQSISASLLYRAFHFETIHTIAYAMMINGLIGGLLAINEGYKKDKRNIFINLALAVVVIIIAVIVYNVPTTYGGISTLQEFGTIQQLNQEPWGAGWDLKEFFIKVTVVPLIGQPEPLLPFLATALIGNVIGILMAREKPFHKEMKVGMAVGTLLTLGGMIGAFVLVGLGQQDLFELFLNAYQITYLTAWLPMYLFTLGTQLVATFLVIRLVEFRGRGQVFAKRTKYFRRHGFVALSIYAYQFLDVIPRWILATFPCIPTPTGCANIVTEGALASKSLWGPWAFLVFVINFALWYLILILWEKVNYIGGYEWLINVLAGFFIKSRRTKVTKDGKDKYVWWKPQRLNVKANFYDVDWINLVEETKVGPDSKSDSKLSLKITAINLILNAFIFFLPISLFGLMIAFSARKTEGKNAMNTIAIVLGILGSVIFVTSIVVLSLIPIGVLGL